MSIGILISISVIHYYLTQKDLAISVIDNHMTAR
jgi:hypothetical protein